MHGRHLYDVTQLKYLRSLSCPPVLFSPSAHTFQEVQVGNTRQEFSSSFAAKQPTIEDNHYLVSQNKNSACSLLLPRCPVFRLSPGSAWLWVDSGHTQSSRPKCFICKVYPDGDYYKDETNFRNGNCLRLNYQARFCVIFPWSIVCIDSLFL